MLRHDHLPVKVESASERQIGRNREVSGDRVFEYESQTDFSAARAPQTLRAGRVAIDATASRQTERGCHGVMLLYRPCTDVVMSGRGLLTQTRLETRPGAFAAFGERARRRDGSERSSRTIVLDRAPRTPSRSANAVPTHAPGARLSFSTEKRMLQGRARGLTNHPVDGDRAETWKRRRRRRRRVRCRRVDSRDVDLPSLRVRRAN